MKKMIFLIMCFVFIVFAGIGSYKYSVQNATGVKNLTGSKLKVYWYTNSGNREGEVFTNAFMNITSFGDIDIYGIDTCYMTFNVAGKKLEVKSFKEKSEYVRRIVSIIEGSDKKVINSTIVRDRENQDYLNIYKDAIGSGSKKIYIE